MSWQEHLEVVTSIRCCRCGLHSFNYMDVGRVLMQGRCPACDSVQVDCLDKHGEIYPTSKWIGDVVEEN